MTVGGFTPAWFCIGQGNPRGLMIFDALPKLAASLVGAADRRRQRPGAVVSGAAPGLHRARLRRARPAHGARRCAGRRSTARATTVLRTLVPTAAIDAAGNAYGSTAIPIATAGLTADGCERLRVGGSGVSDRHPRGRRRRERVPVLGPRTARSRRSPATPAALLAHAALGLAGGLAIALLGPWATAVLFGADVAAQPLPSALFGVAFFCISVATPLIRNLLIPADRFRTVFAATIAAAAVGLVIMIIGSAAGSAAVVSLGVAASEFAALAVLLIPAALEYRRIAAHRTPSEPDPGGAVEDAA